MKLELEFDWIDETDGKVKAREQTYKITGMSPGQTELVIKIIEISRSTFPITVGHIKKSFKNHPVPENPTLFVGEELQFEAKAYDEEGNVIPNTPIKWENLDPEIAELHSRWAIQSF
ncbi:MAG: hypothetical protein R2883_01635 [Caldisericia bacterium]